MIGSSMATTRLRYVFPGDGNYYIDIAAGLSLQERKLIRQKQLFTIHGGLYIDADGSRMDVNTAPNTWAVRRAINRTFFFWRKSIAQTLQHVQGMKTGKWNDFKVYLNDSQANSLSPVTANGSNLYDSNTPEWDYSTLVRQSYIDPDNDGGLELDANPDHFEVMIVGSDHTGGQSGLTRISAVRSWLDTRPTIDLDGEPAPEPAPNTDPLAMMFAEAAYESERIDYIETEGDNPPYSETVVFGNSNTSNDAHNNLQRQCVAWTTANTNRVVPVSGFQALCGLLHVEISGGGNSNASELIIDVDHGRKF